MNFLKKYRENEFFRGSLILLILINFGNLLNYLYQLIMARMLGPQDYGTLAFLMGLTYIFAVPTIAIQTGMAKKISRLSIKKEYGKMKSLFFDFLKKLFLISLTIFAFFLAVSLLLAGTFGISFWILALTGILIIASFIYPVASGMLQGMKKFQALGWNTILIFSSKILIAVVLVLAGFKVYGAVAGFVLSIFIGFIFAFPPLTKILRAKAENSGEQKLLDYENLLIFTAMLIFVFIYSADVIMAKLFFSDKIVGEYAALSMIGKIILFSTMSIGNAFFPISSERHYAGKETKGLMKKAFLLTSTICFFAILIFSLFSEEILKLFFGVQYAGLSNLLFPVSVSFSLIALLNLILLYRFSRDEFKIPHLIPLAVFFIVQIIILSIFNSDVNDFVLGFMFSTIITFIGSLILIRGWKKRA